LPYLGYKMMKEKLYTIEEIIKQILISKFEIKPALLTDISPDTPLLGRGIGLDSIEAMALVAAIEKEFDIEIGDDELTVDLVKNIGSLADHVLKKMTNQSA
jgi:acyl carrier protein